MKGNNMDDSLKIKKMEREMVVLLVAKELNRLAKEAAINAIDSISTKEYIVPDSEAWARKIIAIVKEHSL
jgi:hypothetical protein